MFYAPHFKASTPPQWRPQEYYFVHAGSLTIGRIFQTEMSGAVVRWHWGLINVPPVRGVIDHGLADSRDAAMTELRKAWEAWLAGSEPRRSTPKTNPNFGELSGTVGPCSSFKMVKASLSPGWQRPQVPLTASRGFSCPSIPPQPQERKFAL